MKRFVVGFIRLYQRFVSPFLLSRCRFELTCSHYAIYALEYQGFLKGCWLIVKRLFRCHPYSQAHHHHSLTSFHE